MARKGNGGALLKPTLVIHEAQSSIEDHDPLHGQRDDRDQADSVQGRASHDDQSAALWATSGPQLMAVVIVVFCGLNLVVQSLIQPRFIGDAVGLSVTVTFLALVFWAWLLGPLGAILAIPLTLLVKALLVDIDPQARWVDALLRATRGEPALVRPEDAPPPRTMPTPPERSPARPVGT
jgi:hypothetical protein